MMLQPIAIMVASLCMVSFAIADCNFDTLCGKTFGFQAMPVRTCINGSCTEPGNFSNISYLYFSQDGAVWITFGSVPVPGTFAATFVCRSASTATAGRTCQGAACAPDNPFPLDTMNFVDSCSVAGDAVNLTISVVQSVHISSTEDLYKGFSMDIASNITANVLNANNTNGNNKCLANLHVTNDSTSRTPQGMSTQKLEFFGSTQTAKMSGSCDLTEGNTLPNQGTLGKIVDPGQ
jgi:hypothetical protein